MRTVLLSIQKPFDLDAPPDYDQEPSIDTLNLLIIPLRIMYISLVRYYLVAEIDDEIEYETEYVSAVFLKSEEKITEEELNNIAIEKVIKLLKNSKAIQPTDRLIRIVSMVEKKLEEDDIRFTKDNLSYNMVYEQYYCEEKCKSLASRELLEDCVRDCIYQRHCEYDELWGDYCGMVYENGKVVCFDEEHCKPFNHPLRIYDKSIRIIDKKEHIVEELINLFKITKKLSLVYDIIEKIIIDI